jgi:hypothetical protein
MIFFITIAYPFYEILDSSASSSFIQNLLNCPLFFTIRCNDRGFCSVGSFGTNLLISEAWKEGKCLGGWEDQVYIQDALP